MTTTHSLHELQELDWEIDRCQGRSTSVEEQIEDDSALIRVRGEIEEQQNAARQLHQKQSVQTLELQAIEDRVKALDSRLYGGTVKSPREMESGFNELQIAKEQTQQAEEQLLTMMVALEEAEKGAAKSKEELARMEEERERLYEAVYQSDHWKDVLSPKVAELMNREKIVVTRIEPTPKSVIQ